MTQSKILKLLESRAREADKHARDKGTLPNFKALWQIVAWELRHVIKQIKSKK